MSSAAMRTDDSLDVAAALAFHRAPAQRAVAQRACLRGLSFLILTICALTSRAGLSQAMPVPAEESTAPGRAEWHSLQALAGFKSSEIKFPLLSLMNLLRDRNHEGWVLAAYPDPKTNRPLIGAGFSLDVAATDHPQLDPLNDHPFLEPSSAELWEAAGLDQERLQSILQRFNRDLELWTKKRYRREVRRNTLEPELTEAEALQLLRISAVQAIYNAKAYCRNFDRLTASQQMALSQLVFQMGINLEEFVQFLSELNGDTVYRDLSQPDFGIQTEAGHWRAVQQSLIDSEWARRFTTRATTVIAMFDPEYARDPAAAIERVELRLPPPVKYRRKKRGGQMVRAGVDGSRKKARNRPASADSKRKST
jgi:hypothetical protein